MKTILLKPREEEIRKAVHTAQSFLETRNKTNHAGKESSIYAVMTVRPDGMIVVMNQLASDYLGLHPLSQAQQFVSSHLNYVKDFCVDHQDLTRKCRKEYVAEIMAFCRTRGLIPG